MQIFNLNLSLTPQFSKLGRPYRHKGTFMLYDKGSKWVNKVEKWRWIFTFMYTDDETLFGFEFGYNDEFIRKLCHNDVKEVEERYR